MTSQVAGRPIRRLGSRRPARIVLLTVMAGLLGPQVPVRADVSTDPFVIAGQLRQAVVLGDSALRRLHAVQGQDPLDDIVATMRQMYVLVRASVYGLNNLKTSKRFYDPGLDYEIDRVTLAWNLTRSAVDNSVNGLSREEYLTIAIRDLGTALRVLNQVLLLMP